MYVSVAVSVRKNVLSEQYRSKTDILSGNWKNVKCVWDVFTDVRNLQSAMETGKRTDMDSIKIRIPEFRRKYGYRNEFKRTVINSSLNSFKVHNTANICTVYNPYSVLQSNHSKHKQVFTESGDSIIWIMNLTTYHQLRSSPVRN